MTKEVLLVALLIFRMAFVGAKDTCDYVAKTRAAGSYEPATVKVDAIDIFGKVTTQDIQLCLIKDGEECFPNDWDKSNLELLSMEKHMEGELRVDANRVENIKSQEGLHESNSNSNISKTFRSFSCKSGLCQEIDGEIGGGKCEPCLPPSCTKDPIIKWTDFLKLQADEKRKREARAQEVLDKPVKKKKYKEDLKHWSDKILTIASGVSCDYLSRDRQKDKNTYDELVKNADGTKWKIFPARIEVEKGGGEFLIPICVVPDGEPCFPSSKKEFMALKDYLEGAKVFPEPPVNPYPDDVDPDEQQQKTSNKSLIGVSQAILLKSWNCYSGICHPKTLKCEALEQKKQRLDSVWKVYEYMASTNTAVTRISFGKLEIFVIALFIITALVR